MSDRLSIYLQELEAQREADRRPLDDHLFRLHMRSFNLQKQTTKIKSK